jgi:hypothetical protein
MTPIVNLIALPETRAVQLTMEPAPMKPVANSSRTEDETYSPSSEDGHGRKSKEEEHEDDLSLTSEESVDSSEVFQPQDAEGSQISFFA